MRSNSNYLQCALLLFWFPFFGGLHLESGELGTERVGEGAVAVWRPHVHIH
jgi:hypothetical protein